jgi:hypothetical protein
MPRDKSAALQPERRASGDTAKGLFFSAGANSGQPSRDVTPRLLQHCLSQQDRCLTHVRFTTLCTATQCRIPGEQTEQVQPWKECYKKDVLVIQLQMCATHGLTLSGADSTHP